jgi:hypothetical protein
MTAERLASYVGTNNANGFVTHCWDEAVELVNAYVDGAEIPESTLTRAQLEVGAELFHRKSTKNAVAQFATPDAQPIRIARDPMVAAYPLLARHMPGALA